MKPETLIFTKIRSIIPTESDKTIFFASITQTSYEMFFYTFIGGKPVQCYELAEEGKLDENELEAVFAAVVDIIKESKVYKPDKNNIATITVDKSGVKMNVEYYDKDARMYKIKKEWEKSLVEN